MVNFMMISIGVLFVSTASVSLYAVPKIVYHRGIFAQPRRVDPNTTQGTAYPEGKLGTSLEGKPGTSLGSRTSQFSVKSDNIVAEEMDELKSELSELRNTNMELRETARRSSDALRDAQRMPPSSADLSPSRPRLSQS